MGEEELVLLRELEALPERESEGVLVYEDEAVSELELVFVAADVNEEGGVLLDVADDAGEGVEESDAEGKDELVPD